MLPPLAVFRVADGAALRSITGHLGGRCGGLRCAASLVTSPADGEIEPPSSCEQDSLPIVPVDRTRRGLMMLTKLALLIAAVGLLASCRNPSVEAASATRVAGRAAATLRGPLPSNATGCAPGARCIRVDAAGV